MCYSHDIRFSFVLPPAAGPLIPVPALWYLRPVRTRVSLWSDVTVLSRPVTQLFVVLFIFLVASVAPNLVLPFECCLSKIQTYNQAQGLLA